MIISVGITPPMRSLMIFRPLPIQQAFTLAPFEQGGRSLYPQLAQRVSSVEVLRVLLSIGGTVIC